MKVFEFTNHKEIGAKYIVISKIDSYGLSITSHNKDDSPNWAVVWINVGDVNHNTDMPYSKAVGLIEDITQAIHTQD